MHPESCAAAIIAPERRQSRLNAHRSSVTGRSDASMSAPRNTPTAATVATCSQSRTWPRLAAWIIFTTREGVRHQASGGIPSSGRFEDAPAYDISPPSDRGRIVRGASPGGAERLETCACAPISSRNRFVIGYRRSRPKFRAEILTPGAACLRLYSARYSSRSTFFTVAASWPRATMRRAAAPSPPSTPRSRPAPRRAAGNPGRSGSRAAPPWAPW